MQSFDTKDSNTLESFDRKFESSDTSDTKDSEVKQSDNDFVESSDPKNSEMEQSDNEVVQSSDRKFETREEEALPDSESCGAEHSNVSIPNFDKFNAKSDNSENSSTQLNCACSRSEKSKADGRRKPRSQKQIEAYKRNFSARKSIELKVEELDSRLRHLQLSILSLLTRLR